MKKLLSAICVILLFSTIINAQGEVTEFMGIPIDGNPKEMVKALRQKGFRPTKTPNQLSGRFNGYESLVNIVENNGKVYRIVVYPSTVTRDIAQVKIDFNNLCYQFLNKQNYLPCAVDSIICPVYKDLAIPQDEDILYEMMVNYKKYTAAFYQLPVSRDSLLTERKGSRSLSILMSDNDGNPFDIMSTIDLMDKYSDRQVWFTISEYQGFYFVALFYDNKLNQSQGEDL